MPHGPRVSVVSLGGTIATVPDAGGRAGAVIGLSPQDLVAAVPRLAGAGIALDLVDLRRLPGASITVDDVRAAAQHARSSVAAGAAGVVVTGAMRYPGLAGADGPANLLAAVQVAASPPARGLGCLVVMSDEIHAARWVRKTHTVSAGAFASPVAGPVGFVVEGEPRIWGRRPARLTTYSTVHSAAKVALVTVGLDDDGGLLSAIDDRYAGVVVAGFGAGHVPAAMVEPLRRLAQRLPVVLASRIGAGPVLSATYGFPGSESDLRASGLVGAGFLDPYKARLLLQVLVSGGADRAEVAAAFRSAGRG